MNKFVKLATLKKLSSLKKAAWAVSTIKKLVNARIAQSKHNSK